MADGQQKTVLVTGASRGAGLRVCRALAERGFRVYAGVRSPENARRELGRVPGVGVVQLDVADEESIIAAREELDAAGVTALHGLVNNAGVIIQGPLELCPDSELRRGFEVNVFGAARVTQEFLPLLRAGRGRVLNVTAPTARIPAPFLGGISASKAAFQALSDAWRVELAHWGIDVVVLEPGAMQTEIFATADSAAQKAMTQLPPARRALYEQQLAAVNAAGAKMKMSDPKILADAAVKAMTANRPKARYTVGADTRLIGLLARLPLRTRDRLVSGVLGLSKIKPAVG
ncbi:SDR family NAD(P)-dependent oxidoreductase [Actinospica robiniae]|uniref:SDR family NAD(P)-dependent oxidoreductase n=1 Tax=Actinospica robiniae TaxID=304901 RepID=UPI000559075F|nr:SDR family NAD(P)-dependent oxidoreductase [Actinospica robiniae]